MSKQFEMLVFDWDGTLMDSTATIASSLQRSCQDLGLTVPSDAAAQHVIGLGLSEALAYAVPDLPAEKMAEMLDRYRHHYLSRDGAMSLFPGARDMLTELKQKGHLLAVATGKNRVGLNRSLAQCALLDFFDATRTADESASKPNPRMLFDLSELVSLPVSQMLMVGDTTHDLMMARNAKACAVAVSYGAHPKDQLQTLAPLAVLDTPAQLHHWLMHHA
jgi:phosphoglycolate phosphatase